MRLVDADARVTVQSFDIEHEEYEHTEMSVEEALDFATDEGCPPVMDAIPVAWLNNIMILAETSNIQLYHAIYMVTSEWKRWNEAFDKWEAGINTIMEAYGE